MKAKTTTTLHRRCNSRDIVQPVLAIFIGLASYSEINPLPALPSQRVQVCQQILNVLLSELLAVAWHFFAAEANDVGHTIVVCGQSAYREIFVLEDSLETRAFLAFRGIWLVAAVAVGIVNLAARNLLLVQAELGV